jgi:hypothetical protein
MLRRRKKLWEKLKCFDSVLKFDRPRNRKTARITDRKTDRQTDKLGNIKIDRQK